MTWLAPEPEGTAVRPSTLGDAVWKPFLGLLRQTLGDILTTGGLVGFALLAGLAVADVRVARGGGSPG
jgi:hypothetical protein